MRTPHRGFAPCCGDSQAMRDAQHTLCQRCANTVSVSAIAATMWVHLGRTRACNVRSTGAAQLWPRPAGLLLTTWRRLRTKRGGQVAAVVVYRLVSTPCGIRASCRQMSIGLGAQEGTGCTELARAQRRTAGSSRWRMSFGDATLAFQAPAPKCSMSFEMLDLQKACVTATAQLVP